MDYSPTGMELIMNHSEAVSHVMRSLETVMVAYQAQPYSVEREKHVWGLMLAINSLDYVRELVDVDLDSVTVEIGANRERWDIMEYMEKIQADLVAEGHMDSKALKLVSSLLRWLEDRELRSDD